MRGRPHEVFQPWVRRGRGLTGFRCFSVVVSLSCWHPTLFFMKRVWNNDFGVFRKSPEAKFCSGSFEKPPRSHIDRQQILLTKIKPPNPKDQNLGPKLIQNDSPGLNNKFQQCSANFLDKNPQNKSDLFIISQCPIMEGSMWQMECFNSPEITSKNKNGCFRTHMKDLGAKPPPKWSYGRCASF